MAAYHFTSKAVSFGKGQSAVHTAAYNARCKLEHEAEHRKTHDYSKRGGLEFEGIFAPKGAPDWARDRQELWNRAEAAERQKVNGQPARNVEFAIPFELNAEQRRRLVTDFAREAFARKGMVADVAIHEPGKDGDQRNYHVHVLLTMRKLEGDQFAKTKAREWNSKAELGEWREKWAHMGARALERAGFQQEADRFRHGHLQLREQMAKAQERGDIEFVDRCSGRKAGIHKGPTITAMERRGDARLQKLDRFEAVQRIIQKNEIWVNVRALEGELKSNRQAAVTDYRAQRDGRAAGAGGSKGLVIDPAEAADLVSGLGKGTRGAIMVLDGATRMMSKMVEFVDGLLMGHQAPVAPPSAVEQIREQRRAKAALVRISESLKNAKPLAADDVRNLTPAHLQSIQNGGDEYLRNLVERMESDKRREIERDDRGRGRDR